MATRQVLMVKHCRRRLRNRGVETYRASTAERTGQNLTSLTAVRGNSTYHNNFIAAGFGFLSCVTVISEPCWPGAARARQFVQLPSPVATAAKLS